MNDEEPLPLSDQLGLSLETAKATMSPEEFTTLGKILEGVVSVTTSESDSVDVDVDAPQITEAVTNEVLSILATMATGRMDMQVIDLGNGIATVKRPEDPDPTPEEIQEWNDFAERLNHRHAAESDEQP
ncbi:hypothetical protein ACFU7Y_02895 [Kitasatospora sp. NPDC057542]|uniref:hypothetical protein n=1 Tax=Kitasatospora sp. NPDC057542 TaxID=3346162 RepID=UPI00368CCF98